MQIDISILKRIESISALKVFIYLCENANRSGVVIASAKDIVKGSGIARNSARKAIKELMQNGMVKLVKKWDKRSAATYMVTPIESNINHSQPPSSSVSNDLPMTNNGEVSKIDRIEDNKINTIHSNNNTENNYIHTENLRKTVASKKQDTYNSIDDIDFNSINFYHDDINSLTAENPNRELPDEELNKLAKRVVVEWFMPLAGIDKRRDRGFYAQQCAITKILLRRYRTDQVLAGVLYWTQINPIDGGIKSMGFLSAKKNGQEAIREAMNYFKQQYIAMGRPDQCEELMQRLEEKKRQEEEQRKKDLEEIERAKNMTPEEIAAEVLQNILGDAKKNLARIQKNNNTTG